MIEIYISVSRGRSGNDHALLSPQASPDVDEEGFSLRPGDGGDDIFSQSMNKKKKSKNRSIITPLGQNTCNFAC